MKGFAEFVYNIFVIKSFKIEVLLTLLDIKFFNNLIKIRQNT